MNTGAVRTERDEQRVRALLANVERLKQQYHAAQRDFADGRLNTAEFEALRRDCAKRLEHAETRLNGRQAACRARLGRKGTRLQRALQRRAAMEDTPRARRLDNRIATLRAEIAQLNRIAGARSPEALSGVAPRESAGHTPGAPPSPGEFSLTRTNLLIAGVTAVLLFATVSATYLLTAPDRPMRVHAQQVDADTIQVVCENGHTEPVRLFVPWGVQRPEADRFAYGVEVYVQARGAEDFEPWPGTMSAWHHNGRTFETRDHIVVMPLMRAELRLSLDTLRDLGAEFRHVRLLFTNAAGKSVATFTF